MILYSIVIALFWFKREPRITIASTGYTGTMKISVYVKYPVVVLGHNIWTAWALIIWEVTMAKGNYYRTN